MATVRVTNNTTYPIYLADLYLTIPPLATINVERATMQLEAMKTIQKEIENGRLTVTITPTAAELASGYFDQFTPGQGSGIPGPTGPSGATGPSGPSGGLGPTGPSGARGPAGMGPSGPAGATAYCLVTHSFTQPAVSATVDVTIERAAGFSVSEFVFIATAGYFQVAGLVSATALTLRNTGSAVNAAEGTLISSGVLIGTAGFPGSVGPSGDPGGAGATGVSGLVGASGATGTVGATGASGATGVGTTGATGASGSVGATGASGVSGVVGATGADGSTGATGMQGVFGGAAAFALNFSTQTGNADPGSGNFRFDNATQNLATSVFISKFDANGSDISAALALFDTSTSSNKGYLRFVSEIDPTKWIFFSLASSSDHSAYVAFVIQEVASTSSNPFSDADSLIMEWSRTGDRGTPGTVGATGLTGATGPSGLNGTPGVTGASGVDGSVGATGATGVGTTGATGPSGVEGLPGATGPSGASGTIGATGPSGVGGLPGATGPSGASGTIGATGVSGVVGVTGATGATGASGASSGWTTVYDADWTGLTTSVASANGNFTIDGRVWTIANFAASQTFQITNGTGLVMKCNSTNTDWTVPTDSLTKIYITLTNLLTGVTLDPAWGVRIWVQIAVTATSSFEGATFSYGLPNAFNQNFYFIKGIRSGSTNTIQFGSNAAATNVVNVNDTTNFTDDVLVIEVDALLDERARMTSGVYSGGWPAVGAQRMRGIMRQSTATSFQPSMTLVTDPAIMVGIKSTDSAAVAQLVVKRLRVEIHA